jgi:Sugar transferases involved in lipopolysaccharide synthesis
MYQTVVKRGLDIFLSFIGLLILSPIFAIVSIWVKVGIGSPILFLQKRPGKDEKIFTLYKFRSMSNKCDAKGNLLPDEQRLGRSGKLLRATSLDELPELWNILKGDMSIVGPRPLLVEYLNYYNEEQRHRHDVRPGLTGLAQISGRNAISWEEKFEYDLIYIKNISFTNDLKIILKTVIKIFEQEGIQSETAATMEKFTGLNSNKEEVR